MNQISQYPVPNKKNLPFDIVKLMEEIGVQSPLFIFNNTNCVKEALQYQIGK